MIDHLERDVVMTGRAFLEKTVTHVSNFHRYEPCATLTLPHSTLQPAQRTGKLLDSTRPSLMHPIATLLGSAEEIVGQSGVKYTVLEILQDKGKPQGAVYLATEHVLQLLSGDSAR